MWNRTAGLAQKLSVLQDVARFQACRLACWCGQGGGHPHTSLDEGPGMSNCLSLFPDVRLSEFRRRGTRTTFVREIDQSFGGNPSRSDSGSSGRFQKVESSAQGNGQNQRSPVQRIRRSGRWAPLCEGPGDASWLYKINITKTLTRKQ